MQLIPLTSEIPITTLLKLRCPVAKRKSTTVVPRSTQRSTRFRVSGVRDSRYQKPHVNTNSKFPNLDIPYCYSFPGFPPFRNFGTSILEMRGSPIFRIREMPNPDKPMDFPIDIFPGLLDFRHASSYDGRSSIISRFREIK
jgi:hypothetical protein